MKKLIAWFIGFAAMLGALAQAAPEVYLDFDINREDHSQSRTIQQGTSPRIRVRLLEDGKPYRNIAGYSGTLFIGTNATATAFIQVTSTNVDMANGAIRFDLSASNTNTNGSYKGYVMVYDATNRPFFFGQFNAELAANNFAAGGSTAFNWPAVAFGSNWNYTGVATYGPYRAGTNISFGANADGSVDINTAISAYSAAQAISDVLTNNAISDAMLRSTFLTTEADTNALAQLTTHAANASAHHAKYTDAEATNAVAVAGFVPGAHTVDTVRTLTSQLTNDSGFITGEADTNAIAQLTTHAANASAHHAKYTDAEATNAVAVAGFVPGAHTVDTFRTLTSQLTNDSGFITITPVASLGTVVTSYTDAAVAAVNEEKEFRSTGIYDGGILSLGASTNDFSISDGFGYISDVEANPTNPTIRKVEWTGLTNVVLTGITNQLITFVSIDSNTNVIQQASRWTRDQHRSRVILGVVVHVNKKSTDTVNQEHNPAGQYAAQISDVFEGLGFVTVKGLVFSPNGANMNLDHSEGLVMQHGINYFNDPSNPHHLTVTGRTATVLQYRLQGGSNYTGLAQTEVLPNIYDVANTATAVPANKWTVQRIYVFTSGNVKLQPGQNLYDSVNQARAGIGVDAFTAEPSIDANGVLRGYLVVKQGATSLNDTSQANFIEQVKWGSTANVPGSSYESGMARIQGSTYKTVQEMQDIFHSSGHTTGGQISSTGGLVLAVSAGTGLIRTTNDSTALLPWFDWPATSGVVIASNAIRYVGVEYNAGSPRVTVRSSYNWNFQTDFPLGSVVSSATNMHIQNAAHRVGDHAGLMIRRNYETMPYMRDNRTGGLTLGDTGTNHVSVTAGALWERLERYSIAALDSSTGATFIAYYQDGAGGWNEANRTQWPNTQYDDGSGALQTMSANRYGNLWFYIDLDGQLRMLYPQAQHNSLAIAQDEGPPTTVPTIISEHTKFIGRIIFQESAASATQVDSAFAVDFAASPVTDHGSLSGLNDDDHPLYLTQAEGDAAFLQVDGGNAMAADLDLDGFDVIDVKVIDGNGTQLMITNDSSMTIRLDSSFDVFSTGNDFFGYVQCNSNLIALVDPTSGNQVGNRDYNDGRYALETGDTYTGVHDFGGAGSLEIVNAANPTLNAAGEIGLDTTDSTLNMADGAGTERVYAAPIKTAVFVINADDDWASEAQAVWQAPEEMAITLEKVTVQLMGSSATSLVYNIEERAYASLSSTGTEIYSNDVTAVKAGTKSTSFSNSVIAADAALVVTTPSSPELGTVLQMLIRIAYRLNVE